MITKRRIEEAYEAAGEFRLDGRVMEVVHHSVGHINDTFMVFTDGGKGRYVLQRINTNVFSDPKGLMRNISLVTGTIRDKVIERGGDPEREGLTLVRTRENTYTHKTDRTDYWRCYLYVDGETYEHVGVNDSGRVMAREAARAFSDFQRDLMELTSGSLHTTISDFHNTPKRFLDFLNALGHDPLGRSSTAHREIESCLKREELTRSIADRIDSGKIPIRVTHNDTKINNVIFERNSGDRLKALCVIDLDTVMPGSILFDIGDQIRTTTCYAREDERDTDKVSLDLGLFESLICGYLEGASSFLTKGEMELLVLSGMVITFETTLRFLTDYLMGDVYFKVERPEHNLDRARTQLRLLECMEEEEVEMERIVSGYLKQYLISSECNCK